jgi:hypothetical protein
MLMRLLCLILNRLLVYWFIGDWSMGQQATDTVLQVTVPAVGVLI